MVGTGEPTSESFCPDSLGTGLGLETTDTFGTKGGGVICGGWGGSGFFFAQPNSLVIIPAMSQLPSYIIGEILEQVTLLHHVLGTFVQFEFFST